VQWFVTQAVQDCELERSQAWQVIKRGSIEVDGDFHNKVEQQSEIRSRASAKLLWAISCDRHLRLIPQFSSLDLPLGLPMNSTGRSCLQPENDLFLIISRLNSISKSSSGDFKFACHCLLSANRHFEAVCGFPDMGADGFAIWPAVKVTAEGHEEQDSESACCGDDSTFRRTSRDFLHRNGRLFGAET